MSSRSSLTVIGCSSGDGLRLRFLACLVVGVIVALGARSAQAQLTPAEKAEMKQHYERATRAYDIQKYPEAVDEYQKAYEIGGDPAMLYNIAQAFRLNDQLPEALRFYRRYLQRSPNARNREDVERRITDLDKTVDERRKAAAAAAPLPVEAPPIIMAPPPPPQADLPPQPLPSPKPAGTGVKRVLGIVFASIGGAGLITAGITGKLAADKGDKLTKASMQNGTVVFDPTVESSGKALNTMTIVSVIAGGALAVVGGVLIVTSLGDGGHERPTQAFLSPIVSPSMMGGIATVSF